MDESALVRAAQRGDVAAFNGLLSEYQQVAYSVAYRILGDQDRAEDATQEALLRGFQSLPSFRGGSFRAWLLRIVTNCAYDALRYGQRRPTASVDDLVEDDEHSLMLQDDQETPDEYVQRRALDDLINQALGTLPEDQRTVVILSDIEGLSYEEIAQVASVNLGTVKSRLSRARAKMRDFLLAHREQLPASARLYVGSEDGAT